ncbi:jg16185 [Pararge aegeria aegeria]|uniref:Jg16185 protein n=1 Tax=Pararge aegeria aegeria TaxID=348720 RepID=A0A8S4RBX0_9NEOP|nr:jg16185 [Pararge aegeria aegeria]
MIIPGRRSCIMESKLSIGYSYCMNKTWSEQNKDATTQGFFIFCGRIKEEEQEFNTHSSKYVCNRPFITLQSQNFVGLRLLTRSPSLHCLGSTEGDKRNTSFNCPPAWTMIA